MDRSHGTALVEGLARMIVEGKVPDVLADSTVYSLDLGSLIAGEARPEGA